jgi:RNA-directed DNA polymerase
MRSCSENYQRDAYVLKLDISGFFMGINKKLLFQKVQAIIEKYILLDERDTLLYLLHLVIFTDIKKNIRVK